MSEYLDIIISFVVNDSCQLIINYYAFYMSEEAKDEKEARCRN